MDANKAFERLMDIFQPREEGKQDLVILISQVDPDALGSALGLAFFAENALPHLGGTSVIYLGNVGNQQNRAILNRIGQEAVVHSEREFLSSINALDEDPDCDPQWDRLMKSHIALVDSCQINDRRLGRIGEEMRRKGKMPTVVIDHHRGLDIPPTEENCIWIEEIGSASTLVWELLSRWGEASVDSWSIPAETAAVMALGIHTDTHQLVNASTRDMDAYAGLSGYASRGSLLSLINVDFPESFNTNLERALSGAKRDKTVIITGLGFCPPDQSDDVSLVANHLIRTAGVSLVVVWIAHAKDNEGVIRLSVRCRDESIDLDRFLKNRFGKEAGSKKSQGSVLAEGGANLKLDVVFFQNTLHEIEATVQKEIETRVLGSRGNG